ncbi:MAG TPA: Gfo/Idh/MocA family oxidoreductase [Chthonomonadaceae bacterium]|nr:Gfo/Idh/MocA family oxidoreductase [Chthonomonadaceae bacterium]
MNERMDRRRFLQRAALTGAGVWMASAASYARIRGANDKLNLGVVGVSGRGGDNLSGVSSQNIVALCDIDDHNLDRAKQQHPGAETYNDFRKMMERKDLDGVVVSTPDHCHAPVTALALQTGHHVYCEKPLAHSVWEVRQVTEMARKHKRVTQMGTQIHAEGNYRRVVEMVQSGAIGPIREVHVWADRVWSGPGVRPADTPPVPAHIHWDLWIGPAAERPYNPVYIPATWRGWWDFGNGTLGDMACHHMDLPFWALDLHTPTQVQAEGPPANNETTPEWLIVHYDFPARGDKPPVHLTWYNGGKRPHYFAEGKLPQWGDGTLFVGEKGMLLADYGRRVLLPEKDFANYTPPAPTIPDSIGHHNEWIEACKGNGTTTCRFDYSGPLTETVLLGCVAYRTGQTLAWDAKALKATNCPEADAILRPHYRTGWKL